MIRLKKDDEQLISTKRTVDNSAPRKAYLGGPFLSNDKDYIQAFIHDENENFLESIILDREDYEIPVDGGNVRILTGTFLRKNGYDRGRFVVKYMFLRYVAGSHETVLVKKDGQFFGKLADETFDRNNPVDMQRVTGGPGVLPDLEIKDNKYWVEEISGTRTEVRIVPQNIVDVDYINDFSDMQNIKKRFTSNDDNLVGIHFAGNSGQSRRIQFAGDIDLDPKILTGGRLYIPNAFVNGVTPPPSPYRVGARSSVERDAASFEDIQASFFISAIHQGRELAWSQESYVIGNNLPYIDYDGETGLNSVLRPGQFGDRFFIPYQTLFEEFNNEVTAYNARLSGLDRFIDRFQFQNRQDGLPDHTPNGIRRPNAHFFHTLRPMIFQNIGGDNPEKAVIEFKSNSFLVRQKELEDGELLDIGNDAAGTDFTNQPTSYYWRITGHDWDKTGDFKGWNKVMPTTPDKSRDFEIIKDFGNISTPDNIATVSDNAYQAETINSQFGSTLRVRFNSIQAWYGIGLTIVQATAEGRPKSTIHLPAIIFTTDES